MTLFPLVGSEAMAVLPPLLETSGAGQSVICTGVIGEAVAGAATESQTAATVTRKASFFIRSARPLDTRL